MNFARGNETREARKAREARKRSQVEFNTQEKKGPHCGPRFSYIYNENLGPHLEGSIREGFILKKVKT